MINNRTTSASRRLVFSKGTLKYQIFCTRRRKKVSFFSFEWFVSKMILLLTSNIFLIVQYWYQFCFLKGFIHRDTYLSSTKFCIVYISLFHYFILELRHWGDMTCLSILLFRNTTISYRLTLISWANNHWNLLTIISANSFCYSLSN